MSEDQDRPDAEWHRLLDGELDPQRAAELRAELASQPERQAWFSRIARDRDMLRARLDPILHEPVPRRLSLAEIRRAAHARRVARLRFAAAACLLLGVGFSLGWGGKGWQAWREAHNPAMRIQTVVADAVSSYRTFSTDPRFPVEIFADQPEQLAMLMSRGLGRKAPPPDLTPLGFRLVGGRVVPSSLGRAVMVLYASPQGERVSLYVKAGEPGEAPLKPAGSGEVAAYVWTDDNCAYVMAADLPSQTLQSLAEAAFQHFEHGPGAG